jgi:hypothetical protein
VSLTPEERIEWTVGGMGRHAETMNCVCIVPPEPVEDDGTAEPTYVVELAAFTKEGGFVFGVRVPGPPAVGLRPGTPVKVTGLVVSEWSVDEWDEVWFTAAGVEAVEVQKGGAA